MSTNLADAKQIFLHALRIENELERTRYLELACTQDIELRRQVEALLDAHVDGGSLFDDGVLGNMPTVDIQPTNVVGERIGSYKLRELLGTGGMGSVYVAEQEFPVRRKVALKVIKAGMDTQEVIARFELERQTLALMDHPHIAKVFDAGTSGTGRPYFVMELVRGVPITQFCDAHKLNTTARLELFVKVCHAVQHAHQKGVIHRDLKPSNVLVTLHDDIAVPKVIDFGIAKVTGQHNWEHSIYTAFAQMIGTPMYMSPEQAEMNSLDIDTRSDIYSLGVLLYELITGTTPFDPEVIKRAGIEDIRRMIRETNPPKPSHRISTMKAEALSTISDRRSLDARTLSRTIRGDLDWIVMKTLEKDRTRRYETPGMLAADILRYLHDRPVAACPPSITYQLKKYVSRKRKALALSGVAAGLCLTALVTVLLLYQRHKQQEFVRISSAREALTAARAWIGSANLEEAGKRIAEAKALLVSGASRELEGAVQAVADEVAARKRGEDNYTRFLSLSEIAQEKLSYSSGGGGVETAREALSIFQILENKNWQTQLDQQYLTAEKQATLKRKAYQLLVALADFEIRWGLRKGPSDEATVSQRAQSAFAMLDRAALIQKPTRAFHFVKAQALSASGDEAAADGERKEFAEATATSAWDYYLPGHTAGWNGDTAEAIRSYEAALTIQPDHFNSLFFLSERITHLDPPQYERAIGLMSGCIALRPKHSPAYSYRAGFKAASGDLEGAEQDLRAAMVTLPEARDRFQCSLYFYLLINPHSERQKRVELLNDIGGPKAMLSAALKFTRLGPAKAGNDIAWDIVSTADSPPGYVEEAVSIADEAARNSPLEPGIWNTLGVAQYRDGDYQAAIESLTKSMKFSNEGAGEGGEPAVAVLDAFDSLYLAMCYQKLGASERARAIFDSALQLQEEAAKLSEDKVNSELSIGEWTRAREEAEKLLDVSK